MKYSQIAGLLLFIAGLQFFLSLLIAESLYPGYSTTANYISDLGIGNTALLFNVSIVLLGALILISSYLIKRDFKTNLFTIVLALTGIGAVGVGIFPENTAPFHMIFSLLAFVAGAISAIMSYKFLKPPLQYVSIFLGILSLIACVLFISLRPLGPGGTERLIFYPVLFWILLFSGFLMNKK